MVGKEVRIEPYPAWKILELLLDMDPPLVEYYAMAVPVSPGLAHPVSTKNVI